MTGLGASGDGAGFAPGSTPERAGKGRIAASRIVRLGS
jgi:hypothetical protein